ncbi:hypothetical protein BURK1_02542 [Burkholderiales bacterium]|nr:hypothetical protein BURK1_02542 [Burkholderiales bacterium]
MRAGGLTEALVLAHQLVGYLTAFVVAPMALSAFAEPPRHRVWARTYLCLMVPLYLTGLSFTFRLHEAGSFVWARNLAFNFTGFFFLLLGWRAIVRFRRQLVAPQALDHAMRGVLLAGSGTMVLLGVLHHFPSFALGCLGLWMGLAVLRETGEVRALYVRHQRSMLTSAFYVFTVLSLVHVKASTDVKWLWPALVGVPLVVYATRGPPDRRRVRLAVRATLGIALALAAYIAAFSPPEFLRA